MASQKDILLDNTGDMAIANGDFFTGDSDNQSLTLMIWGVKGQWKNNILQGLQYGIYLKAGNTRANIDKLKSDAQTQLKMDNWNVKTLNIPFITSLKINAERIK